MQLTHQGSVSCSASFQARSVPQALMPSRGCVAAARTQLRQVRSPGFPSRRDALRTAPLRPLGGVDGKDGAAPRREPEHIAQLWARLESLVEHQASAGNEQLA